MHRSWPLPFLVLALLVSSGCGSSGASQDHSGAELEPAQVIRDMKASAARARTTHMEMTVRASGVINTHMSGDIDLGDPTSMDLTIDRGQDTGEVLVLGGKAYFRPLPVERSEWTKLPDDQAKEIAQTLGVEPTFAAFEGGLRKVTRVGSETIDGDRVAKYDFVVDLRRAAAAAGDTVASEVPDSLTYSVWLGDSWLMRRIVFEVAGDSAEVEFTRWGEPLKLRAPASYQGR